MENCLFVVKPKVLKNDVSSMLLEEKLFKGSGASNDVKDFNLEPE
jgi:hypothetical protein